MNYGPKGSPMTSKYRSRRLSNSTWHYVSVVVLSDGKIHTTVNSQQHTSTIVSYIIVKKSLYIMIIVISGLVLGYQIYSHTTEVFGLLVTGLLHLPFYIFQERPVDDTKNLTYLWQLLVNLIND